MKTIGGTERRFLAVVFEADAPGEDFGCTHGVMLPGDHTEREAWQAIWAALRGPDGADLVGGEVRPS